MLLVLALSDTPPGPQPDGFSVLRGQRPSLSPKALLAPLSVLRRVMVPVQARSAHRAGMPADGEALLDQHATARTGLARERRVDRLRQLSALRTPDQEIHDQEIHDQVTAVFVSLVVHAQYIQRQRYQLARAATAEADIRRTTRAEAP
jgi:hypothetical protein